MIVYTLYIIDIVLGYDWGVYELHTKLHTYWLFCMLSFCNHRYFVGLTYRSLHQLVFDGYSSKTLLNKGTILSKMTIDVYKPE
ncbi:hypothetical protein [Aquimarina longa]|uniref:hypothetical protein n=1 Tax=Aquimarina longa TaxID=1080221 RepID=UPI0011E00678|nr:hypothetical protein [Aquimarina longa]